EIVAEAGGFEREIVRWTNVERLANGEPALAWSPRLAFAAREHSAEMARLDYFSHASPVPAHRTLMQRVRLAGVRAGTLSVGENIAKGTWNEGDGKRVVGAWMESAGHRHNLL